MKRIRFGRSRGSTLVLNLLALAVFAMLGVVVYRSIRSQVREVVYQERLAQSLYIAEAGLEDAMLNVYNLPTWRAGFNKKPFANGYYTVTLSTDSPPLITSTGYSQNIAMFGRAFTTVSALAQISYSNVTAVYAIMAQTLAQVNGPAVINAYYPNVSLTPTAFSFGAGIWSNTNAGTTAGAVVNGNAYYVTSANIAPGTVFGNIVQSTTTQVLANHTCASCKNTNHNNNLTGVTPAACYNAGTTDLTVNSGATCALKAGLYYFNNITVNGTLNVDTTGGAVVIYFSGILNSNASGSINNLAQNPALLSFYGEFKANTHLLASHAPLHAYLEEPGSTWNIHGPIYGHIWGNNVTVYGDGLIHADIGGSNPNAAAHVGWKNSTWTRGKKRL